MSRQPEAYWERILLGEDRALNFMSRMFRSMPSAPRCKMCLAPFEGPVAPFLRLVGFRRWPLNQQLCRICVSSMAKQQGGAEVPVSLLFADVRGSTALAETMQPKVFARTMNDFFHIVAHAVDEHSGVIDHIVGDGVMAMWIPAFVGPEHARRAVDSGRTLVSELRNAGLDGSTFPAGVGVHTGIGYVGVIGEPGSYDFTVQGDVANTAARLGSSAANGELMLSDAVVTESGLSTDGLAERILDLKGKSQPMHTWVDGAPDTASSAFD